jgi:hypothetical protein
MSDVAKDLQENFLNDVGCFFPASGQTADKVVDRVLEASD